MKSRQLSFSKNPAFKDHKKRVEHGGGLRKGRRKLIRPFDSKKSLHVTLRSSRARGAWSFLRSKTEKKVNSLVFTYGAKFNVRIQKYANAGNHLHLLLRVRSKRNFQNFLRTLSGMIPRIVAGAQKGQKIGKFWDD